MRPMYTIRTDAILLANIFCIICIICIIYIIYIICLICIIRIICIICIISIIYIICVISLLPRKMLNALSIFKGQGNISVIPNHL